jgi:hypothetical protein
MEIRSLRDLSVALKEDAGLRESFQADPATAIQKLAAQVPIPDTWVYRLLILILGVVVIGIVSGGFALAAGGKQIPEALVAIGSTALGALAGLLAPSPVAKN